MSLLQISGLSVRYGDSQVLWDINLQVEAGEIVALVGANGAGKTTLLRTLAGLIDAAAGHVRFQGADLLAEPAERRVRTGIALVPEGRRLFAGLTALENLRIGAYSRSDAEGIRKDLDMVFKHFPELQSLSGRLAGHLSGGQQQMCAIGRALMARPRLLLVDEMSLGLAPVLVDRLAEALIEINRSDGVTILLIEQDVELALEMSQRGYVLDTGRIVMNGPSRELLARSDIREAYMGLAAAS